MQQPEIEVADPKSAPFDELIWDNIRGLGYCPVRPASALYGLAYWEEYRKRAATPMGRALTKARVELVTKHIGSKAPIVDVGVGSGQFIEEREGASGFDVNPIAVEWLMKRRAFVDEGTLLTGVPNLSFWDSLEHIDNPAPILAACTGFVFVSIPICDSRHGWLQSKHYKPGEHLWYFSWRGLVRWFQEIGFELRDESTMETDLGREGILSFVFGRRK